MKQRSFKNTNLIGWIIIILGFSFLYFSYFFIYIPKQEAQLKQRAFRILKEYGSNILDKHNYYKNHFNNFAIYYGIRHFGFQPVPENKKADSTEIQKFIDGLFNVTAEGTNIGSKEWPDSFKIAGSETYLRFHNKIEEEATTKIGSLIKRDLLDSLVNHGLFTNIPVSQFMTGLKFDQLFENIVLFDESQIYYNSNQDVLTDVGNPVALSDSIKGIQGGTYLELDISGEDTHVMILPVHFIGKDFFLAGFISDAVFQNITRTINNQLLIFLAGLLLLILIGMPVLKVIFLSPDERLKSLDASSSVFSFLLGTGLLVLLTISIVKQQFTDRLYYTSRIKKTSDLLIDNVKSDINSIKKLYLLIDSLGHDRKAMGSTQSLAFSESDTALMGYVDSHFFGTLKYNTDTNLNSHFQLYESIRNSGSKYFQDPSLQSPFPLNEIILINDTGIISKAITSTPFSDVADVDLSNRNYFLNVKDTSKAWTNNQNLKYYIESIQSYNTGQGETAVSFYTKAFGNAVPVLAITSVIPSLYNQVLPKDIEFLIMNDKGKVLYHSIKSKNLHENFLEECESDIRLMKAVDLRIADNFLLNYNGKKWFARIIPVEDTPLYHITLVDMNPTNNMNARIFLFSFYFLTVSVFFLLVGIIIKRLVFPSTYQNKYTWILKWLDFRSKYFLLYKKLIVLIVLSVLLQVAGIFVLKKPVAVLFHNFFFIVYIIYVSMLVLKRRKIEYIHFLIGCILILAVFLIELLLFWQNGLVNRLIFLAAEFLAVVIITYTLFKKHTKLKLKESPDIKVSRKFYILFLFMLLVNSSVISVFQFYFTVRNEEVRLWNQEKMFKVANDNLLLQTQYEDYDAAWFKKIQGNGIDSLKVSFVSSPIEPNPDYSLMNADRIYSGLFDPITKSYQPRELFSGKNFSNEWVLNDSLVFMKAGKMGTVTVNSDGLEGDNYFQSAIIIIAASILIFGFIWYLLNYLASVIFNLHPEKVTKSKIKWERIITDPGKNRILLKTFNGDCYFRQSVGLMSDDNSVLVLWENKSKPEPLHVSQLLETNTRLTQYLDSDSVVWINGLDHFIYQVDKHDSLLSLLMQVNQSAVKKIIVDMPFDIELINEYYDDYIADNELKPEETAQLLFYERDGGISLKTILNTMGISG